MRTDIHSPKRFIPEDYVVLDYFGLERVGPTGSEIFSYGDEALHEYLESDPSANPHPHSHQCDLCGTRFVHGAVLKHSAGDIITVGGQCMQKIALVGSLSPRERFSKTIKEKAWQIKAVLLRRFIKEAPEGLLDALRADHDIIRDLRRKAISRGRLSPAQVDLAFKINLDVIAREKRRASEPAPAPVPVTSDRIRIKAELVFSKTVYSDYGSSEKGLFLCEVEPGKAFKLWGTVPSKVDFETNRAYREGRRDLGSVNPVVEFTARVEPSADDQCFGFFKRPTKVEVSFPEKNRSETNGTRRI